MPEDVNVALDLLRATPPPTRECFPARLGTARKLVNRILSDASNPRRCFRSRSGVVEAIADANQLRPGDVMVIDAGHPVCRARIVHEDPRDRAVDVYELTDDGSEPDVVRIGRPTRRTIDVGGSWQRSRASSATPQGHAL